MNKKFITSTTMAIILLSLSSLNYAETSAVVAAPSQDKNFTITMERTACFGTCPVYKLIISGDGKVVYQGNAYVKTSGVQTYAIPVSKVTELVNAFKQANFFGMQDRYDTPITDMPSTIVSISMGGKTKTVFDYYGAPEILHNLENKIDEIANANALISAPPEPPASAPESDPVMAEVVITAPVATHVEEPKCPCNFSEEAFQKILASSSHLSLMCTVLNGIEVGPVASENRIPQQAGVGESLTIMNKDKAKKGDFTASTIGWTVMYAGAHPESGDHPQKLFDNVCTTKMMDPASMRKLDDYKTYQVCLRQIEHAAAMVGLTCRP